MSPSRRPPLIVAEYDELPAVFDEVEAAQNDILVHDELKPAGTFADLKHLKGAKGTNIALDYQLRTGDVDEAFASAAAVFEHEFRTQKVLHLPFEPFVSIADFRDTRLTLYTASQGPSFVRIEIARLLGWPENRVRVKVPFLGGGYGAKLYIKLEALVTALSMIAKRPVKVALPFEEMFYTITRHPTTFRIKSAVDADGRLTARALRGVLERRRLCRHRAARGAEVGVHRLGPLRDRRTCRSIPTRSTPTSRRPARCAASACRNWCGPTSATPT